MSGTSSTHNFSALLLFTLLPRLFTHNLGAPLLFTISARLFYSQSRRADSSNAFAYALRLCVARLLLLISARRFYSQSLLFYSQSRRTLSTHSLGASIIFSISVRRFCAGFFKRAEIVSAMSTYNLGAPLTRVSAHREGHRPSMYV